MKRKPTENEKIKSLTELERKVLELFADGYTVGRMSNQLDITTSTISFCKGALTTKLGTSDTAALCAIWYRANPSAGSASSFHRLSQKERKVLELIAAGKNRIEIAEEMHISVDTVASHKQLIRVKLRVSGVALMCRAWLSRPRDESGSPEAPHI